MREKTEQPTLFPIDERAIPVYGRGDLDATAARLAVIAYAGAETLRKMLAAGDSKAPSFDPWCHAVAARLAERGIEIDRRELQRVHDYVSSMLGSRGPADETPEDRKRRLRDHPALPAGAMIAYFKSGKFKEGVRSLSPGEAGEPTALFTLDAPLHFRCHGQLLKLCECPLTARMRAELVPEGVGEPAQEAERFVLESPAEFERKGIWIHLKYPSLNKACAAIFRRLHLREGKQNSNRHAYYHTAWVTQDEQARPEFRSFWSIRDEILQRTWTCP